MTSRAGRKCQSCEHKGRAAIDAALVQGESLTAISENYGITPQSLIRHRDAHLPRAAIVEAAQAGAAAEVARGSDLLTRASKLLGAAEEMMTEARAENDMANALRAIREAGRLIEVCAKLTGEIDTTSTINVFTSPAYLTVQVAIVQALEPHPAAKAAVIAALEGVR